MGIDLIHVSDIHFGSGESHGRINPATGLNIRFEDFVKALTKVVDYTISNNCDIFLFSGDAYRNASPEPIYQKMFGRELSRLSKAGIKTVLVVGNHDQVLRNTQSHSMSVFESLEVPGLTIIDKPQLITIDTKNGALQLIGLPHITRHELVSQDKYRDYSARAIDQLLIDQVRDILRGYYLELDPGIPAVATAHMALDCALPGIENELLVGYSLTFPSQIFIDKRLDYVALGHIHRHQVLRKANPAIVFAGSLERVDFGEEKEDKGFVHACIERNKTSFAFHSIEPRPFLTMDFDLTASEDPTLDLLARLEQKVEAGCVLRLRYKIDQEQLQLFDETKIKEAAIRARVLSCKLVPEVVPSHKRSRMPDLTESAARSPFAAIELYLGKVEEDDERRERLLARANKIISAVAARSREDKTI